jgi:hypothetical protein
MIAGYISLYCRHPYHGHHRPPPSERSVCASVCFAGKMVRRPVERKASDEQCCEMIKGKQTHRNDAWQIPRRTSPIRWVSDPGRPPEVTCASHDDDVRREPLSQVE